MNKEEYIAILEVDVAELRNEKEQLKEQLKIKEDGFNATISELCDVSEKLQQRDEVIDKTIRMLEINIEITKQQPSKNKLEDRFVLERYEDLLKILKKAKGDSNE